MPKITPNDQLGEGKASAATPSLQILETTIQRGQGDYVAVGRSLAEIQSARLYKITYNTFEEYCEKRWGFVRQHARNFIHAAAVSVQLIGQNRPSFTQAIELARVAPDQQQAIAARIDFESATVKEVKAAVDRAIGKVPEPETPEPKEISLESALDVFVTKIVMQPYGYSAAKFAKYPHQHPAELELIAATKKEVYYRIGELCQIKQQ